MRSLFAGAIAWAVLAQAAPCHAQQQGPNPLPPGEGRDIVAVACTQCHGPNAFAQLREGPDAWRFQVYDMILRGAQVQPSEIEPAVNYLATNFGPGINLPPTTVQVSLPDGPGKDLVEQRCVLCHGLDRATSAKRAPAEWDRILRRMVFLGAPVSADEVKTITTYLGANFGAKQAMK
jgi:mono/diheme cytochrome c family protein